MGLLVALTSCPKAPAVEYKLTPEQLAWQGYRAGEVLRFGHALDNKVRTYQITEVRDRMETDFMGYGVPLPFPRAEPPLYQKIAVWVLRTDTVSRPAPVLELSLGYNSLNGKQPELRAQAEWESFYYARLPINEVDAGLPIDTLQYAATLLPGAVFGAVTYAAVIRVDNKQQPGTPPLGLGTRRLYYARGKGIVAFEESGSGLWYRLP